MLRRALLAAVLALALVPGAANAAAAAPRVLLFTKTAGFRHTSIGPAVAALSRAIPGAQHTEDAAVFRDGRLRRYDAVVFLLTSGDVLDARQQAALKRYVRAGGGWVGVHSAADTERDWPFYGRLLGGARFASHPPPAVATVRVDDPDHPATRGLPASWTRLDEWYAFTARPRAHVLLTLTGPDAHAVAWWRRVGRGRAFYTALGHTDESWADPAYVAHVAGGIRFAAGAAG
jgi:type 1 glutamine amidotransferase